MRLVVNRTGDDVTKKYSSEEIRLHCANASASLLHALCKTHNAVISRMFERSAPLAHEVSRIVIDGAVMAMHSMLDKEIERMRFLMGRNGETARHEIECLVRQRGDLEKYLAASTIRLDAVRLIYQGNSEEIQE
jgi:ATP-dependent helicase HepA